MKNLFKKPWIWIILVLVIAGAAAYFYFGRTTSQASASAQNYQTTKAQAGDMNITIDATGTVRASQSATLTWLTSGKVEKVNVVIGDKVSADEVLANLQQASLPQSIILAESDLVTAKRDLENLLTSNTTQAEAEQAVATAKQAVEDAQNDVFSINYPRASDTLIENTQANIDLAKQQVARASDIYRKYARRADGDPDKASALANLTNAQLNLNELIATYNWYAGKVDTLDAEQLQAALAVAQAQLADAERDLDRVKNGPDPDDVAAAKAKITSIEAILNQAKITAPFNGVITQASPQPGDMVSTGSTAFRLDNMEHLLVDVSVSEVDINKIAIGQAATLEFDAANGNTYDGKVVSVNLAGDTSGNTVNFSATVEITNPDEQVKPGMTANVTIVVKELKNALLIPNRAITMVDSVRSVYIMRLGNLTAVPVEIGSASDTVSEVTGGGLQVGDTVILNPTGATTTQSSEFRGPGFMRIP
jgi:HlyD family secretion protein